MERCWILVGMMGAGKSSVGRALAEMAGRSFEDTDLILQHRLGWSIPQLFQRYGEDAFREHETTVLRSLQPHQTVLATGGGIVMRADNWVEMRRLGSVVYLRADAQTLKARLELSRKKRPLLDFEDWETRVETLLAARSDLYAQADVCIDVDGRSIDDVAREVLQTVERQ